VARRRFVWSRQLGELVEIGLDQDLPSRQNTDAALWGDREYTGLKASDGTDISSRSKHREYMKLNDLTTIDDFKNEWSKPKQFQGSVSRQDIERTIHQLENRRK
jgi:hypothetical protein